MNFFNGTIRQQDSKLFVDCGSFSVPIPSERAGRYGNYVNKKVVFGIRPEDVKNPQFLPPNITTEKMHAKVEVIELMGNEIYLYLVSGGTSFVARVDPRTSFRSEEHTSELQSH